MPARFPDWLRWSVPFLILGFTILAVIVALNILPAEMAQDLYDYISIFKL
jgi:hypothetical protein